MKIKQLKLTNFRCFESLSIDMDEQLTVLIAPNGLGKTAVLDATAIAFGSFVSRFPGVSGINPNKERDIFIRTDGSHPPYMRIHICLTNNIEWDRTEKRDNTERTKEQIPHALGLKNLYQYADSS